MDDERVRLTIMSHHIIYYILLHVYDVYYCELYVGRSRSAARRIICSYHAKMYLLNYFIIIPVVKILRLLCLLSLPYHQSCTYACGRFDNYYFLVQENRI